MSADRDLISFVREHIRSVWALELLLLLRRDSNRYWAPSELVRELRASDSVVSHNLAGLERAGLVVLDDHGAHRYAPPAAVVRLCDELDAAYRERPFAVIGLISSPPDRLQALADAFRFRGDRT